MLVPFMSHRVMCISFPVMSKNCNNSAPPTWHHPSAVHTLTATVVAFNTLRSYFDIHSCAETKKRAVCVLKKRLLLLFDTCFMEIIRLV